MSVLILLTKRLTRMCYHETGVISNGEQIILFTKNPPNAITNYRQSNTHKEIIVFSLRISLQLTCFYLQHPFSSLAHDSTVSVHTTTKLRFLKVT